MVKNLPVSTGDLGSIPGSRRFPGGGNGNPLQYSCLGSSMDRRVWQAIIHGVTKNQTWMKQLSIQYTYSYDWFTSLYGRSQHDTVKPLCYNEKENTFTDNQVQFPSKRFWGLQGSLAHGNPITIKVPRSCPDQQRVTPVPGWLLGKFCNFSEAWEELRFENKAIFYIIFIWEFFKSCYMYYFINLKMLK